MVNLLYENPALQGMQQANAVQAQQASTDLQRLRYDESRRTADAEAAADVALRDWITNQGGGQQQPMGGDPNQAATLQGQQPMPAMQGPMAAPPVAAPATPNGINSAPLPGPGIPTHEGGNPAIQPLPNAPMGGAAAPADLSQAQPMGVPMQPQGPQPSAARTKAGLDRTSLARTMAGIPGMGQQALSVLEQQDQQDQGAASSALERNDHMVTNFFKSLQAGDTNSAMYWGQQAGIPVTPEMMQDADFMKFMGTVGDFKDMYGSDHDGFNAFYQSALQLHQANDPQAYQKAFAQNPPTEKTAPRPYQDKLDFYDILIKRGFKPEEAQAIALQSGGRRGAGSNGGVYEVRRQAWLRVHPGDEKGALSYAAGKKSMSYGEARKAARAEALALYEKEGLAEGETVSSKIDELTEIYMGDGQEDTGAGVSPGVDPMQLSREAYDAISQGAPEADVKARYKQQTGQDLPPAGG